MKSLVPCHCNYECKRFRYGFRHITEAARLTHTQHDVDGNQNRSNAFFCYCTVCGGNEKKSISTIYRHQHKDSEKAEPSTSIPPASITEPNRYDIEFSPNLPEETQDPVVPQTLSIEDQIRFKIIKFQSILDSSNVSISNQDSILKTVFGNIADTEENNDKGLVSLLRSWNGEVNGEVFPNSLYKIMKLYEKLGMIKPKCYKLCTGSSDFPHNPILMEPSLEDDNSIICCHNKPQRLCSGCCSKCTMCSKMRKDKLSFYYIPVGEQLKLMCQSRTLCHEFLTMWRHRTNWLNKELHDYPDSIKDFWDGSKVREWSNFWDPTKTYELPVICSYCQKAYATFPNSAKVPEINDNWNEDAQCYQFPCTSCSRMISEKQRFVKVPLL